MKKLISLLLAIAFVLSLCGCGQSQTVATATQATDAAQNPMTIPASEPVSQVVTDMIGRQVDILPGSYSRVVCIGAGALRIYSYVGDMNLLCGVEDIDNTALEQRPKMFDGVARPYVLAWEETLQQLPSCGVGGPMAQTAEAEKILSCEPDIVISQYEDVQKADALQEQLGVPVITLKTGADGVFDQAFFDSLALLGTVFGKEARAQEIITFVQSEMAEITARVAGIPEDQKPGVYVCGLGNWGTTDHLMTAQNFVSFRIAGVRNVVQGLDMQGVGPIEEEKFVALGESMDIIIMDAAAVKNIIPLYQEDPTMFDTCKAWGTGEVYLQMAYNAYYVNYEISLINTWFIAKTVYPEAFADIDITEKTNQVTTVFQGMPLADKIFACPASFGGYGKIDPETLFA